MPPRRDPHLSFLISGRARLLTMFFFLDRGLQTKRSTSGVFHQNIHFVTKNILPSVLADTCAQCLETRHDLHGNMVGFVGMPYEPGCSPVKNCLLTYKGQ